MGMPRGLLSGVAIIALDDDAHRAVSGADDQRVFRMDTGREQFGRKQQRNEHKHKACDQLEVTQGSHDVMIIPQPRSCTGHKNPTVRVVKHLQLLRQSAPIPLAANC